MLTFPRGISVWLLFGLVSSCAGPPLEPGFGSVDPQERTAALLRAARGQDRSEIPALIGLLWSSDPAERMLADEALRRLTGQDHGYRHYDPPSVRARAAEAWRQWWLAKSRRAESPASPTVASSRDGGGGASPP